MQDEVTIPQSLLVDLVNKKFDVLRTQEPEFGIGGVPIKVAAKVFGKSETWVRNHIRLGTFDIGFVTETSNFYISPRKLWQLTGYIYKGEENEC